MDGYEFTIEGLQSLGRLAMIMITVGLVICAFESPPAKVRKTE